jgi:hypothetical protein
MDFLMDEESVVQYARQAIQQPEDSWFGNDNLWLTHGMSGFTVHRDSPIIERSNFEVMVEFLTEEFGDQDVDGDWWVNHANHWAVGWADQIMVRILIDPDLDNPFVYSNITNIFKSCMECINNVQDYVIMDEYHYNNLVEKELLQEINDVRPSWANENFDASAIASLAYENEVEINENEDSWMIGEQFVEVATFVLGMFDNDSLKYGDIDTDLQSIMDAKTFGYWDTTAISQTLLSEFFDWLSKDQLRMEI